MKEKEVLYIVVLRVIGSLCPQWMSFIINVIIVSLTDTGDADNCMLRKSSRKKKNTMLPTVERHKYIKVCLFRAKPCLLG